jgi:hypothetical protein
MGTAATLSISQGIRVRNVDFPSLRKRLIAQNVPLPGVYPAKYKKGTKETVAVYEPPTFGERVPQKRNELPERSGIWSTTTLGYQCGEITENPITMHMAGRFNGFRNRQIRFPLMPIFNDSQ